MPTDCVEDLMRDYRHYDQCVDVVSIFQMLFEQSETQLPETVVHFERFPTIGKDTPDFTVVFTDGTGLVGEIANVARNDQGRDKTCYQLAKYDQLTQLPVNSSGLLQPVEQVDVLFLTPLENSREVAGHILRRLDDEDHDYTPSHRPCIVGYRPNLLPQGLAYVIMDPGNPTNGRLREDGRPDGIGAWLDEASITVPPAKFEDVKAESVFMNDPPKKLYMATALWARVLPTLAPQQPRRPEPIDVTENDLADLVRNRYGIGSLSSVREALEVLERANYAARLSTDGAWRVAWEQPRRGTTEDLAQQFAEKFCRPPKSGAVQRLPKAKAVSDNVAEQLRLDA